MASRPVRKHGRYLEVPSQLSLDTALSNIRHSSPRISLPRQIAIQDLEESLPGPTGDIDMQEICEKLRHLELSAQQRSRLETFLLRKQRLVELTLTDFEIQEELGSGNSGIVEKVLHTASSLVLARKVIRLEVKTTTRTQIVRELQLLHGCISPYLVGFYGAYFHNGDISLYMEYMDVGSVESLVSSVGRLPELVVSRILSDVLRGLLYLRNQIRICHQDMKPSNILLSTDGEVKLCDFSVSGLLIDSTTNSFVGTRSYMAPERLTGELHTASSDVWSLGLSAVEMAIGRYPIPAPTPEHFRKYFSSKLEENMKTQEKAARESLQLPSIEDKDGQPSPHMTIFELLSCIVERPPPRLPTHAFSHPFVDFVDRCLRRNCHERASLDTLIKHPFIKDTDEFPQDKLAKYVQNVRNTVPSSLSTPPTQVSFQ